MDTSAPSSNVTLDGSAGADAGSSPFSLLNVVGLFLTLSLILLTQPIGSLLYAFDQASGSGRARYVARNLFFLWRLNPLAGFVEALMISWILMLTAYQIWKGNGGPRDLDAGGRQWRRKFQLTAAALLLLRAKKRDEEGRLVSQVLFDNWQAGLATQPASIATSVEGERRDRESRSVVAPTMPAATTATAISAATSAATSAILPALGIVRRRTADLTVQDSSSSPTEPAEDGGGQEPGSRQGGAAAPSDEVPPPTRQSTTRLEQGITATSIPPTPAAPLESLDKLSLLKAALGSNAISHSEIVVDAFTFLSVIFVIVKLATTVLPWHIRIAATCMISSWFTVQTLVALLHTCELSELDMEAAVERAWHVRLTLEGQKEDEIPPHKGLIYMFVLLPVFGYFAYVLVTQMDKLPLWISIPSGIVCGLSGFLILGGVFKEAAWLPIVFVIAGSAVWRGIFYFSGWIIVTSTLCLFFFFPMADYNEEVPWMTPFWFMLNYGTTAMLFAAMLHGYDEAGTYKPAWLDVLG